MASSMSSQSDRSDRSGCLRCSRRHREETRMKINLPIFKDKDLSKLEMGFDSLWVCWL